VQENHLLRIYVEAMRIARVVVGFLVGYAIVVLTTEFGFRLLPRHALHSGDPLLMASAAAVALTAGFAGGAAGVWIAGSRVAGAIILAPLLAETYWLLFLRRSVPPADWLDAAAALALLAAVAAGTLWSPGGRRVELEQQSA